MQPPDSRSAPSPPPGQVLWGLLQTLRPHQWVKNVFVLAPVVFAREIFDPLLLYRAGGAFIVFCVLAGAVYTMNDLVDREADMSHPIKRHRPIASGQVPRHLARWFAVILVASGILGAAKGPLPFLATVCCYFVVNIAYSFRLKKLPYLDVGAIALGFVLRVLAGGFATRIHVSGYLLVCTALLALFLGFGKRRHELVSSNGSQDQRTVLSAYSKRGLDVAMTVTATATVGAYLAYCLDPGTIAFFKTRQLWATTVFVGLAQWRFIFLVRHRHDAESPTQEMLKDGPFVGIVLMWVMLIMWMVYNLQPAS
jgi:decaprenyl-phosphate phosphoribosyltransferase